MPLNLAKIKNSEFAKAKLWYHTVAALQCAAVAIAVFFLWKNADNLILALAAFLIPAAIFVAREFGAYYYGKGERVRRLHALQDGMGLEPSEADKLDILSQEALPTPSEPQPIGSYYSSNLPQGTQRLLHIIQESAFWTKALARRAASIHYGMSAIGVALSVIFAYIVMHASSSQGSTPSTDYSRMFAALLIFFVSGTTATSARSYDALAKGAGKVFERVADLRRDASVDQIELYKVLSAYDSALAKALPIPSWVYKSMQAKLQNAWDDVRSV